MQCHNSCDADLKFIVMPGLVPGIHDLLTNRQEDVDGWDRPGHDGVNV